MSRVTEYEDRYGESIEYLRESFPAEFKPIRSRSRTEPDEDPGPEAEVKCSDTTPAEFVKCYGCRLTFPKEETIGGFCAMCADINEKEETPGEVTAWTKSPRSAKAGREPN